MRISDWSSDVCSSDLQIIDAQRIGAVAHEIPGEPVIFVARQILELFAVIAREQLGPARTRRTDIADREPRIERLRHQRRLAVPRMPGHPHAVARDMGGAFEIIEHPARRSEAHTSELQSLMRTSYAVFCLQ